MSPYTNRSRAAYSSCIATIGLLLLSGCGGSENAQSTASREPRAASSADAPKPTGTIITVLMITDEKGNYFSPATIDAARGDVIRFTLKTGVHNVSFPEDSNSIKGGLPTSSDFLQLPGQEYDLAVTMQPGSYYFHCDPHAALGMKGKLNVR